MKEIEKYIVLITVIMAFIFWYFSFVLEWGNFWLKIAISASMLAFISLARMSLDGEKPFQLRLSQVFIGVISAVLLYWIFVLGRWFLEGIIPFTAGEIQGVYALREGTSTSLIVFLLLVIILYGVCLFSYYFLSYEIVIVGYFHVTMILSILSPCALLLLLPSTA